MINQLIPKDPNPKSSDHLGGLMKIIIIQNKNLTSKGGGEKNGDFRRFSPLYPSLQGW